MYKAKSDGQNAVLMPLFSKLLKTFSRLKSPKSVISGIIPKGPEVK